MVQSALDEYNKPTIKGRISSDGSIGELKAINIQSSELNGTCLMKIWDQFCQTMTPSTIYLEDDAKIELTGHGSYNLRLFRYFTTEDKGSWYTDSFGYQLFDKKDGEITDINPSVDPIRLSIEAFKKLTLSELLKDANKIKEAQKDRSFQHYLTLLEELQRIHPEYNNMSLSAIAMLLGKEAKEKNPVHPIHPILNSLLSGTLEIYSSYQGNDTYYTDLREKAEFILMHSCLRKHYSSKNDRKVGQQPEDIIPPQTTTNSTPPPVTPSPQSSVAPSSYPPNVFPMPGNSQPGPLRKDSGGSELATPSTNTQSKIGTESQNPRLQQQKQKKTNNQKSSTASVSSPKKTGWRTFFSGLRWFFSFKWIRSK